MLTIAPSKARIAGMVTVQRKITSGRVNAVLLYATPQRMSAHGVFGSAWLSADSDGQTFLREVM